MRLFLTFSILFSLLLQSCADQNFMDRTRKDQSILQGNKVSPENPLAKSIVLFTQDIVYKKGQPFFFGICTGLVISKRVVLTAAHCIDHGYDGSKIVLNPSPRDGLQPEEIFRVINAKMHPSYEMRSATSRSSITSESLQDTLKYDDIALLLVDRDFPTEKAIPYHFIRTVQNIKPESALIAGFGKTTLSKDVEKFDYKDINGTLKQANVKLSKKSSLSGRILLTQKYEAGVCRGDSGAPMFVNENGSLKLYAIAVGVFSKLSPVDPDLNSVFLENECSGFGVYLVLAPLQEWILKTEQQLRSSSGLFEAVIYQSMRSKNSSLEIK